MNWLKALRLKHEIAEKLDLYEEMLSMMDERLEKLEAKVEKEGKSRGALRRDINILENALNSILETIESDSDKKMNISESNPTESFIY